MINYFKEIYEKIENNWNVETSLHHFGVGKTNEGSLESQTIKRYYVVPYDKRFQEIYINFDVNRNVESIVWFFDKTKSDLISLAELIELFGSFKTQNVIYDETTELIFTPNRNPFIQYVGTRISEWVEKRKNGTMFFKKENQDFEIDDNFKISNIIFKLKSNVI